VCVWVNDLLSIDNRVVVYLLSCVCVWVNDFALSVDSAERSESVFKEDEMSVSWKHFNKQRQVA
jgi:hypothetical protein